VAEPIVLAQPLAESDEPQVLTKEPTIAVVQHGEPAITIVAEQSESVVVPSCSSPVERHTSKSGTRKLSKRSSIRHLEVPSDDNCGSNQPRSGSSRKTALPPWKPTGSGGSRSSSNTASGHTEEAPRRSSSKTALSPTGQAPRRLSSKKSTSCNDLDAADNPESRADLPTEALVDKHDALLSMVGPRPNSRCANRLDSSTSDPFGEDEQALHRRASKHWPTRSSGGGEILNWQLPSPDSVEDCSVSDMRGASRSSSKRGPEIPTMFGASTMSRSISAGGLPARDRSTAHHVGSMRELRRLSSKQALDSGPGLQAVGSGRVASKNVAEKRASITLNADRIRRTSSNTVLRSPCRLVPDADCSGLFVTGAELLKGA